MQVVTLTTPGTHVESPTRAVELASLVNDEFCEAMDTKGKHVTALATRYGQLRRRCARARVRLPGADHILAGSDYPHQIGSIPSMLDSIQKLPISADDRAGILGQNAARLLGLA